MLSYFSGLRDGARTGARGRMRWCRLALGAGEIKGEQEPARGKQELSKQRELQTRAGYLQSEGGAGGEVRGGKLGRLAKRCALLPSAPARFGSRIHICRAHRQLCYSPAHSHEATHISLSYIYSRSSELARMKRGRIFAGKKKKPSRCRAGTGCRTPRHRLLPASRRGPPARAVGSQHQRTGRAAGASISPRNASARLDGGTRCVSLQPPLAFGLFPFPRSPSLAVPRSSPPASASPQRALPSGASIPRALVRWQLGDEFCSAPSCPFPSCPSPLPLRLRCSPALSPPNFRAASPVPPSSPLGAAAPFPWLPLPLSDCYAGCS